MGVSAHASDQCSIQDVYHHIQKYCRKLKDIKLYNPGCDLAISECICSYEGQLESVTIRNMDLGLLRNVVQKCTNARFILTLIEGDASEYLRIIAGQLESIHYSSENLYGEGQANPFSAWNLCPNIREITISSSSYVQEVEAIVGSPKLFLKKITLGFFIPDENVKDALAKLAGGYVTTLEVVNLSCLFPSESAFESLVSTNKSLRKVTINLGRDDEYDDVPVLLTRTVGYMKCFFRAPSLEFLQICDHDYTSVGKVQALEEFYRSRYRYRPVHLRLFGQNY